MERYLVAWEDFAHWHNKFFTSEYAEHMKYSEKWEPTMKKIIEAIKRNPTTVGGGEAHRPQAVLDCFGVIGREPYEPDFTDENGANNGAPDEDDADSDSEEMGALGQPSEDDTSEDSYSGSDDEPLSPDRGEEQSKQTSRDEAEEARRRSNERKEEENRRNLRKKTRRSARGRKKKDSATAVQRPRRSVQRPGALFSTRRCTSRRC